MKLLIHAGFAVAVAFGAVALEPRAIVLPLPKAAPDRTPTTATAPLPPTLAATGLYGAGGELAPDLIAFAPQYPLWTDGLRKRRWLALPPGAAIDAADPDAWRFPPGTRLWKEFARAADGRPVETRFVERRADGSWHFATYLWNAQGSAAGLAPEEGAMVPVDADARHAVPARADCLACHDAGAGPVLGVNALQLSADRDPLAPHAESVPTTDLSKLVTRGLLRGLPTALMSSPPRVAAVTGTARAALGYLHGNCGHCHNDAVPLASLDLSLAQSAAQPARSAQRTLESLLGHASRFRAHGSTAAARVVPGSRAESVLAERMTTDNPFARMPPLGVRVPDTEALALIERWIQHDLPAHVATSHSTAAEPPSPPGPHPRAGLDHPGELR
jgi:hypothetical protein